MQTGAADAARRRDLHAAGNRRTRKNGGERIEPDGTAGPHSQSARAADFREDAGQNHAQALPDAGRDRDSPGECATH
ncbi:hypothetical protein SDC9_148352 [bioreactor metagenome]|uniref:Uncharacterized protein n=1 Tax=bioreactor metagenome TaxID=1076179 RepID=A0A645EJ30_9ZZZZ